jgi:hypothetical protein
MLIDQLKNASAVLLDLALERPHQQKYSAVTRSAKQNQAIFASSK